MSIKYFEFVTNGFVFLRWLTNCLVINSDRLYASGDNRLYDGVENRMHRNHLFASFRVVRIGVVWPCRQRMNVMGANDRW